MRETFFLMKDFGYDNFEKNNSVITNFKNQGKLDNMMAIQQALERSYNSGGGNNAGPSAAAASQAAQAQPPP